EPDRSIYILDPFEGDHFGYLKSQKCRICGPQCVLSCLKTKTSLPNSSFPVYTASLREVHACCTSVPRKERQHLHDYIHMMGGTVMRDFTESVTHLIAGEVGSKKYSVACSLNKPVMLPEWVFTLWEDGKSSHVVGTDPAYDRFKCPIFKGCTICVTGLDAQTRQEVKQLCNQNGGVYSGELNMNTCTHLLVNQPKGEKYEFARKWNIHCVSTQWFYDCIRNGFWVEESGYRTLSSDLNSSFGSPSTKAAQAAYKSAKQRGDGELIDNNSRKGLNASRINTTAINNVNDPKTVSKLEELDLDSTLVPGSMFLDGCKLFLSGFSGPRLDKLRKIINTGGGTRFNMINEIVSHVVVGGKVAKDVELLKGSELQPHVVTVDWIIESAKSGRKLPEEDYTHPDFQNEETDDSFPSLKENREPGADGKGKRSKTQPDETTKADKTANKSEFDVNDLDDDDVFLQYMSKGNITKEAKTSHEEKGCYPSERGELGADDVTMADGGVGGEGLLPGKTFAIEHFDKDQILQLQQLIVTFGGTMVKTNDKPADFCILPMNIRPDKACAKQMVTFCWLEKCLEVEEVVDPDSCFLFRPFVIPGGAHPLTGCVITISQYIGVERDHMMQLAELLGAIYQEKFARVNSASCQASTHLICKEPEGSKYAAAKKWKKYATTCNWLFACAKTGELVPVEDFPVLGSENDKQNAVSPQKMDVPLTSSAHKDKTDTNGVDANDDCVDDNDGTDDDEGEAKIQEHVQRKKPPPLLSKAFRPSFDLSDAMEALASPYVSSLRSRKSRGSRNSFPLDDYFQENIMQAVKRTANVPGHSVVDAGEDPDATTEEENQGILHGLIISISKKLVQQQTELYGIASSLGADYRWVFDDSCTHLIHQGRANDNSKECTTARSHGMFIVSPYWLHTCAEEGVRVEEGLYPHTYNPKMSLSVVTTGHRRLTRQSSRVRIHLIKDEMLAESSHQQNDKSQQSEDMEDNDNAAENDKQEDLQRQLEDFMVATKVSRGRRKSRRLNSCSSTGIPTNTSSSAAPEDSDSRSSLSLRRISSRNHMLPDESEHSQVDTITYDDPAGRLEREKIMAQLNKRCSPSPDFENNEDNITRDEASEEVSLVSVETSSNTVIESCKTDSTLAAQLATLSKDQDPPSSPTTQTPLPLPVAFQPKEEHSDSPTEPPRPDVYKFQLSAMTPQEKADYSLLIEQLGGKVFDTMYFNPECTHVVVGKPNRNEKYLAAMAAGKWVLHKSYLEASREEGVFVREAPHEWGVEVAGEQPNKLATAAKRWRCRLAHQRKTADPSQSLGAFTGWSVFLCVDKSRQPGFKRLLEAGGAKVVSSRPPYSCAEGVTHAFVNFTSLADSNKGKSSVLDIASLQEANVLLVKPDYIAEFLMQDPPPNPAKFVIPEAKQAPSIHTSQQRKRKGEELYADDKRVRLA
ncbi:predicted protein, partial [Nematostella vectensis]